MRLTIREWAYDEGLTITSDRAIAALLWAASTALSEGERLELQSEPGRALSETEAADAIRAGRIVEVVS
jgi:hypothetical protein